MSENTKSEKVVVVANLKSPVVGFVLALFLGWLGVDRFYKGGIISIVLGIVKLIFGLLMFFKVVLVAIFLTATTGAAELLMIMAVLYIAWYVLDLIFVPLGIVLDNRRKLAIAKNTNIKAIDKILSIIASAVIGIIILLLVLIPFMPSILVSTRMDADISSARIGMANAQRAIKAKVFADNIDTTKPKAPNGKSWGEWIVAINELDRNKWAASGNGIYPKGCDKETPLLWINPKTGAMHFNPSKLKGKKFCEDLRDSYISSNGNGDKIVPLAPQK